LFWVSDGAWARIKLDLLTNQLGARRVNDGRVTSGIIHMLKSGGCWGRLSRCLRLGDDHLQSLEPAALVAQASAAVVAFWT